MSTMACPGALQVASVSVDAADSKQRPDYQFIGSLLQPTMIPCPDNYSRDQRCKAAQCWGMGFPMH